MFFTAPFWLLGLAPLLALTLYLLSGGGTAQVVPFLALWPWADQAPRRRKIRRPPAFLVWMILAMLLAVLAAAGPSIKRAGVGARHFTIVLDRGIGMSASGAAPFRGELQSAAGLLGKE